MKIHRLLSFKIKFKVSELTFLQENILCKHYPVITTHVSPDIKVKIESLYVHHSNLSNKSSLVFILWVVQLATFHLPLFVSITVHSQWRQASTKHFPKCNRQDETRVFLVKYLWYFYILSAASIRIWWLVKIFLLVREKCSMFLQDIGWFVSLLTNLGYGK